jgi:hypothetical protein
MRAGAGVLVALSLCAASGAARADNKAWTTAKKTLAPGQQMVVVANFSAIHDSQLFQTMWPLFLAQHKDAATMLGKTKATCGFDAVSAIDTVVLAMPSLDGSSDNAAFVVSLKGVGQKEVDACITKLEKAETGKVIKISTADGVTTYDTGGDQLFMRWTDKSTLVFSAAGKANLAKMATGGLGSDKAIGAAIGHINSDAALSVIYAGAIPLDQISAGMKSNLLYASAVVAKGNVAADVHILVDSAKTATDGAGKMSTQLAAVKGSSAIPPAMTALVSSLAIKAAGSEIVVSAKAPEKDILGLASMALGGGTP